MTSMVLVEWNRRSTFLPLGSVNRRRATPVFWLEGGSPAPSSRILESSNLLSSFTLLSLSASSFSSCSRRSRSTASRCSISLIWSASKASWYSRFCSSRSRASSSRWRRRASSSARVSACRLIVVLRYVDICPGGIVSTCEPSIRRRRSIVILLSLDFIFTSARKGNPFTPNRSLSFCPSALCTLAPKQTTLPKLPLPSSPLLELSNRSNCG
mmetsp:Transcript_1971/g.4757  ORF Transcript_1971/g.4757 Transcript_1971/m.4757 type:complete len:212 (+) Transcript_1971:556-1191(+)